MEGSLVVGVWDWWSGVFSGGSLGLVVGSLVVGVWDWWRGV